MHNGDHVILSRNFPKTFAMASFVFLLVASLGLLRIESMAASPPLIISWGNNTPDWNRKLHVSAMREGCSGTPSTCIKEVKPPHGEQLFLSILLTTAIPGQYGAQYGVLARHAPWLVEIGPDDFVNQCEKVFASSGTVAATGLTSLIEGIKDGNPNLGFGLTVYEDELQSPFLSDPTFPAAERAKVDYVHLFLHYRADTPQIPEYVLQAKAIFPNAKVILGVYPYDRISYLPCAKGGSQPCTREQELNYLRQDLDIDLGLVKDGTAAGLEFFPGSFGNEAAWKGWDEPRICPGRKPECVQNTQQMDQVVADEFSKNGM